MAQHEHQCEEMNALTDDDVVWGAAYVSIGVGGDGHWWFQVDPDSNAVPISFCPFCGEPLGEGEET